MPCPRRVGEIRVPCRQRREYSPSRRSSVEPVDRLLAQGLSRLKCAREPGTYTRRASPAQERYRNIE